MKAQTSLLAIAALAVLSTVPAFASFELTLISESNSNAIRRVDPENRVVLGSFGANNLNEIDAIAIDQDNNLVYVANHYVGTNNSRITVLNYNTGAFVNEWSLGANYSMNSIAFRSGFGLYVPVNDGIRLFQPDGTIRAIFSGNGLTSITSVSYSSQLNKVFAHDAGGIHRHYDGSIVSGTTTGIGNAAGIFFQRGFSAVNGNTSYGGLLLSNDLLRFDHSTLTTTTVTQTPGFDVKAVNPAHGNRMYAGGSLVGVGSYITTFDQQGNQVSDRWTVPGGTGITSMATVAAPEPGTMIAVGAGLAFLAKRRKRS